MDSSQYIIKLINKLPAGKKLNYEQTRDVMHALTHISEEKELINQIVSLTDTLYNIEQNQNVLTKREVQVFELIGTGCMSSEIARILNISKQTVSTHRKNIKKKLKLKDGRNTQNFVFQYINNKQEN